MRLWDIATGQPGRILEGHTGFVNCVSFSSDGLLLASKSNDGTVRIWRCDTWDTVATLKELAPRSRTASLLTGWPSGLAFHPSARVLATLGRNDTEIRIWDVQPTTFLGETLPVSSVQYANAKVVLVGDTGVGKTALAESLIGSPFVPTESSHGRHVWTFDVSEVEIGPAVKEVRETLLWDLAGQPGYRLIHQLYLGEVTVALVIFDARSETDTLAGIRHWDRALRQAQMLHGFGTSSMVKFLVAARTDRGGISFSRERVNSLMREFGFNGFFETSAKEGRNITELAHAIRGAISWKDMPRISSTELFQSIKVFLIQEKKAGRILSSQEDLYRAFLTVKDAPPDSEQLRSQFGTCVGRVEASGLIKRLSFGGLVLLQPELLDSYASAIITAAKDEPDGLGCILEDIARSGNFRIPQQERLQDREQEKLLLIATVEDLLRYEIALREQGDEGPYLVFPSQLTREKPDFPDPEKTVVTYSFHGPVVNIYATLVIRLLHSGLFRKKELWRNAATYVSPGGGTYGISLQEADEGAGELTLFFDDLGSEESRFKFEEYVRIHLERRALPGTIRRHRTFICARCGTPLTEVQVNKRRERGLNWITCNVCDDQVSILDREGRLEAVPFSAVVDMDCAADAQRQLQTSASVLQGKIATRDFDVFLAYNREDSAQVQAVADSLKARGLYPWLDREQVAPGRWFQDVIQSAIPRVKSAAIFIGPSGLGRWQSLELRSFVERCVECGLPVIPVLLPGVGSIPDSLSFLRQLSWVRFRQRIDEAEALANLEWGITDKQPGVLSQFVGARAGPPLHSSVSNSGLDL